MAGPFALLRSMLTIQRAGETGVLDIERDGVRTYVYFRAGRAVFAEESTLGETLGRLLLRLGLLTDEQHDRAIARMTDALIRNEQMRFGEVVVELGYLSIDQVRDALAEQVRRRIVRAVVAEGVSFSFDASPGMLDGIGHFPTPIEPLVVRALKDDVPGDVAASVLASRPDAHLRLTGDRAAIAARFEASPEELRWLERIDGTVPVSALLASASFAATGALRAWLAALVITGDAELTAPASEARVGAPEPVVSRSDGSAEPGAEPRAVRTRELDARRTADALRRLVRDPPARPPEPTRPPAPAERATRPSTRPSTRPTVDTQRERLEAEQAFLRGKRDVRGGAVRRGLAELRRAAELNPDAPEYALHLGWAEFLVNEDITLVAGLRERLKRLTAHALRQDRALAMGHFVAAQIAMQEGDDATALRFARNAAKLDATDTDASRLVRLLERRAGSPK
jgi:hypothetical protein